MIIGTPVADALCQREFKFPEKIDEITLHFEFCFLLTIKETKKGCLQLRDAIGSDYILKNVLEILSQFSTLRSRKQKVFSAL